VCSQEHFLKAFQPVVADQFYRPFFSLECHKTWTTVSGYEFYKTWLKNSKNLSQDTSHAQVLIDGAAACNIKQFQDIVSLFNIKSSLP
jgi:hypothetical protein